MARLRPHVKTHKMPDVIRMQLDSGITKFKAATLAEAAQIKKGEQLEWLLEDRNTFLLRRVEPKKSVLKRKRPLT